MFLYIAEQYFGIRPPQAAAALAVEPPKETPAVVRGSPQTHCFVARIVPCPLPFPSEAESRAEPDTANRSPFEPHPAARPLTVSPLL